MNEKNTKIVIDIDNLRARKILKDQNNHFFIKQYSEQIKHLIERRIQELNTGNGSMQDYFEYKMHDSILIYGTRGNGKTTIMMNLKEMLCHNDDSEPNKFKMVPSKKVWVKANQAIIQIISNREKEDDKRVISNGTQCNNTMVCVRYTI